MTSTTVDVTGAQDIAAAVADETVATVAFLQEKRDRADLEAHKDDIRAAWLEGVTKGAAADQMTETAQDMLKRAEEQRTAYYAVRVRLIGGLSVVQGLSNRAVAAFLAGEGEKPMTDQRMSQLVKAARVIYAAETVAGGEKGRKPLPAAVVRNIATAADQAKGPVVTAAQKMAEEGKSAAEILRTLKTEKRTGSGTASGRGSNRPAKKTGKDVVQALQAASDALTNGATLTDEQRAEVGRILAAIARKSKVRVVENHTGSGTSVRA